MIKVSRRHFLIIISGLTISAAGILGFPNPRRTIYQAARDVKIRLLNPAHIKGPPENTSFDADVLKTVAFFTNALVGSDVTPENLRELMNRLDFAIKHDSGWKTEYLWLADHANKVAHKMGSKDLASSTLNQRDRIIKQIMDNSTHTLYSRVFGIIPSEERERRRMFYSTVPHLIWIYKHSGVPFRLRGYTSWPGVPGDPLEYTRPGPITLC